MKIKTFLQPEHAQHFKWHHRIEHCNAPKNSTTTSSNSRITLKTVHPNVATYYRSWVIVRAHEWTNKPTNKPTNATENNLPPTLSAEVIIMQVFYIDFCLDYVARGICDYIIWTHITALLLAHIFYGIGKLHVKKMCVVYNLLTA